MNHQIPTHKPHPLVKDVTDANFMTEVLESKDVTFVLFYRNSCSSCTMFEPTFEQFIQRHKHRIKFVSYNTDVSIATPFRYDISGEPTSAIFYSGEYHGCVLGACALNMFEYQMYPVLAAVAKKYNLQPIIAK